ncbi:MAG TPA: hypothetical protein VK978_01800 [Candidatus Saccharimonadales bacterium]|nr:hypothetical protein [Candidatus Saccharimonadales bacterium]
MTGVACAAGAAIMYGHGVLAEAENTASVQFAAIEQMQQNIEGQQQVNDRLLRYAGGLMDVTREELAGNGLRAVEDLPGYSEVTTEGKGEALSSAAVTLYQEYSSADPSQVILAQSCSGTYVEMDNQAYVLSAKHCFDAAKSEGAEAAPFSIQDIVAVPAGADEYYTATTPISGAIYAPSSDYALLKIDQMENNLAESLEPYAYQDAHAKKPIPGEAVSAFSTPGAAYGKIAAGEGIYLGRVKGNFSQWGYELDIVGLTNTSEPGNDACNYGSSGSIAETASGAALGPLTYRNLLAYPGDDMRSPNDNPEAAVSARLRMERQLVVDMSRFTTICGYTVPDLPDLLGYLQTGDPALLPQKGGGK